MLSALNIQNNTTVSINFSVTYNSALGNHRDELFFDRFNTFRDMDWLPDIISRDLQGKQIGYQQNYSFEAGELLPAFENEKLHRLKMRDFRPPARLAKTIKPRSGRYFPGGWFRGIHRIFSDNFYPVRIVSIDEEHITADSNHPLARFPLTISLEVEGIRHQFDEHGGRSNDCMTDLLAGPGMQIPVENGVTDFFKDDPFARLDNKPDHEFYHKPRLVEHFDQQALDTIKQFYNNWIRPGSRVLDLMSSINSHLDESKDYSEVIGLGMKTEELESNPLLDKYLIQDLNQNPILSFEADSFDVVLCTASVEYLTSPFEVFEQVLKTLKPYGQFICCFTNRWFATKSIQLWANLHEFERMGLVQSYFQLSGFDKIDSLSVRGRPRPLEDRYNSPLSDPLYFVIGSKRSNS